MTKKHDGDMKTRLMMFSAVLAIAAGCSDGNGMVMSRQGSIDVVLNAYFGASNGLDDHRLFHLSRMDYDGGDMVEFAPNPTFPEIIDSVYYIDLKDRRYYTVGGTDDARSLLFGEKRKTGSGRDVGSKELGVKWTDMPIPHYESRRDIADTVLYGDGRAFARFEIDLPDSYSIYYIHRTDTILPYSLNPEADGEYGGRLERIDSYDRKRDLFTTIVIIPRSTISEAARPIFEYNREMEEEERKAKKQPK